MSASTLLPCIEGIAVDSIVSTYKAIVLRLSTTATYVACPLCGTLSGRVHSRYHRTLADLPWNRVAVRIHLRSRKLFCDNPACQRRIFTEPLPELAARYARKTLRLQDAFYMIGYALGGKAGARVAVSLGLSTSADTLLRRVRRVATQNGAPVSGLRVVGVDDWAFRKGHRYGTMLVDLETHRLIDLLPERSSDSLAAWLKQHPDIELLSRDRAQIYAEGAREGAPQAQHVADRWHLLPNLGEAMQRLTAQHAAHLRQAAKQMLAPKPEASFAEESQPVRLPRAEQRRLERCEQRLALYNRIMALRQQGWTVRDIGVETGISKRTAQRFLRAQQFPARARRRPQTQKTDRYEAYLCQRMEAGCRNAAQLYREIKTQGYAGCYTSVSALVSRLRDCPTVRSPAVCGRPVPSSGSVAWWLQGHFHPSKPEIAREQRAFLEHLYRLAPVLQEAAQLAQEFARIVRKRQHTDLAAWLEKARQSACHELQLFVQGLRQDLAAVQSAVTLEWSNGQVEGQVNRLKMLKRQMYGRAKFDLLRARVMPMAQAA